MGYIFVFNRCSQAFITKRFIYLAILKLFIRFLYYVLSMPAFQADTVACTIVQFGKFIYQSLHETENLYKLHKQKHGNCNFVQPRDNEKAKRP